jgi:membrane protease YdiL (CAAX protease family)
MTLAAMRNVIVAGLVLQAIAAVAILCVNRSVSANMAAGLPVLLLSAFTGAVLYAALLRRIPQRPLIADASALRKFALTGTALAIVAISEEIIWRGWAFDALRVHGLAAALVLTTVGFAIMHAFGQSFAGVRTHVATGLLFGVLRLATGSIGAAIAAHITYNEIVLAQSTRAQLKGDFSRAAVNEA